VTTDDVTTQEDAALAALGRWLRPRLPAAGEVTVANVGKPGSGFSAETTIIEAGWADGDERGSRRLVLRKETPDPPVYPTQVPGLTVEVDIQYRIMDAVASHSQVPIAPLVGYEADRGVLGTEFFVMGFVDGEVPIESPMYTTEGFFTALTAAQRTTMIENGVRAMAAVHAIDWRAAGLEWLTAGQPPTARRQLDIWAEYAQRELRGREHPLLARALEWLHAEQPPEPPPVLCWGDPRPGNVIWRDQQPMTVTDFEAASIAPAEVDLGWWLMFDRTAHEQAGVERLPGDPTRDEQRAMYEEAAGRSVGDTSWYEVFAAARYCAIVVRVMNRLVDRGDLPEDQTIWIDNPVVPTLRDLLDVVGVA
jgi:aminoglycoside phosphotransferase (APT) family kinase protein